MSWKNVKLGDILTESKEISEFPNPDRRITVRLKVLGVEKRGLENEVEGATKQYIRKAGQFIYGKQNFHKGAFGIVPQELNNFESSSDLPAFDVDKSCLPEFIFYFFKQGNFYLELSKIASGVATQRINTAQLFQLELLLPDIKTQKKLIANIESLETNGGAISTELTHQLHLVKKLRQQLLQDAVQGKLVEQNKKDEPASELLKKIKAERLNRDAALARPKKEKELAPIKPEEIPFEIPENWVWCRLGEILFELKYGTSQSCDYDNTKNSPVLRIPNVSSGILNGDDLKYTNLNSKERIDLALEENDILIIRSNGSRDLVGRTVLVHSEFIGFAYAGYLIRLRFNKKLIGSKYLLKATSAPYFRELIETPLRTTVGINNINTEEISNLLIPFPPILEQDRISTKVEELMQYCNELEASIKQSESQNVKLLQQVLREALRKEPVEA